MLFKNKNFTTINLEVTNIVYCVAESAPNENWTEYTAAHDIHDGVLMDNEFKTFRQLWIEDINGVRCTLFGHL